MLSNDHANTTHIPAPPPGHLPDHSDLAVQTFRLPTTQAVVGEHNLTRLPADYRPFTDQYFLNTGAILQREQLNPWVKAQVVIRKGPGIVGGLAEAVKILKTYSELASHGGIVKALQDGANYESGDAVMTIEGLIQDFVELETMYLGVISAESTRFSDGTDRIDPIEAERRMRAVHQAAEGRPIIYMGARHWSFRQDAEISAAAFRGGASSCSTQIGADSIGTNAVGTIPHVLENIMAWRYSRNCAVEEATKAFDRCMEPTFKRIALIDYNNREIDDALATARALNGALYGVRVDTCGENIAQGAALSPFSTAALELKNRGFEIPSLEDRDAKYWYGNGVTITGVYALRSALDQAGFNNVKIVLSSSFGDPEKVAAFLRAERLLKTVLVDSFGVGGVFDSRAAKMDIVAVGDSALDLRAISKAGRIERVNPELRVVELG